MRTPWPLVLSLLAVGCANPVTIGTGDDPDGGGQGAADGGGDGSQDGGTNGNGDGGSTSDGGEVGCTPPQVLILLDRTGTMHRDLLGQTPPDTQAGHESSKHHQAITALDAFVAKPQLDQSLQLGLALFPQDPGGASACLTLTERLQGKEFANPGCEQGQIVVSPALGTGGAIGDALDPETTTICFSTPTGSGLVTATNQLAAIAQPGVKQYVMLVTDGADFYASCPDPDPMVVLREMQAAGIDTFIVGFGAQDTTAQGVNPPLLNRMACAGHTAKDFDTACQALPDGGFDAVDPDGARLYYDAANAADLDAALKAIASTLCCGCIL